MFNSGHKIFRYFLLCFITGIGFRSFFEVDYLGLLIIGLFGAVVFFRKSVSGIFLIGLGLVGLGIFWYQLNLPVTQENKIWFYNETNVTFRAVVTKEPDFRLDHIKLIVELVGSVEGKVLLKINLYPEYQYGDLLEISCRLRAPGAFNGFAYDRYLAKDDIHSVCYYPEVKLIGDDYGDLFLEKIFLFKTKIKNIINSNLPEPLAGFFSALTLGTRQGLPEELLDNFSLTGTIHLISISGLHITILSTLVIRLLLSFYIPRIKAFWAVTVLLILYLILIGFPAAAIRAAVMGWFAILALNIGRLNQSANTILFAATLMLVVNPKLLRDDVGFQLSCAAMLGLIYFFPLVEAGLKKIPPHFGIRESLAMTISAQITTAPLVMIYFGNFSVIAPLANTLVTPALPLLMMLGFGALMISLIFPLVAIYAFWPALFLLQYIVVVVNFFGGFFWAGFKL